MNESTHMLKDKDGNTAALTRVNDRRILCVQEKKRDGFACCG
jgi:hypothetical protein